MIPTMRHLLTVAMLTALFCPLGAADAPAGPPVRDSLSFFPDLIIVGQVVAVTPFSVTIRNTRVPTTLTPERLDLLRMRLAQSKDDADSAFHKALRTITVTEDSHMQMNFYFDTVNQLFHDDANTYQQFLPLFYLFKSNIKELQGQSKDLIEHFSDKAMDYYLTIPFVKKLMSNAWFAATFRIHPETKKIIYRHSRFYESYEELEDDAYARENMIRDVVEKGLTTTLRVALVRGYESKWNDDAHKKYKDRDQGNQTPGNNIPGVRAGSKGGGK